MDLQYSVRDAVFALLFSTLPAAAAEPIKIGDVNSWKAMSATSIHYRRGAELAIEEVNAKGGILGRPLAMIDREDGANPGDAVRAAEELLGREKVDVLAGTSLSHVGLAVTDFAKQRKIFFLAAEALTDKIVWQNGNRYTYRVRPSTYSHAAAVVPMAAQLNKKRWALLYPSYEYGQAAVEAFKALLSKAQPGVEFVADMGTPLGKIEAGAVAQALLDAKPDAIFNVLFGADLAKFVREGESRGLFQNRQVVSLLTGQPEYLDPLGPDAPRNWIVTGYPWYAIKTPEHDSFLVAYQKKFNDYPRIASINGYVTYKAIAEGVAKTGSSDSEKLAATFSGLSLDTPFGKVTFRPQDHQSTLGIYVGRTDVKDGKGFLNSFEFIDGSKLQASDEDVKKIRPAE